MKAVLSQVDVEIVRRSDQAKGFVVLPKRWVVERTLAWLNRCRRLSKDSENLNRKAQAFLLMASIRFMVIPAKPRAAAGIRLAARGIGRVPPEAEQ